MRPYLAIIKDSFREAMASRVLWILLLLTTFLLVLIAPLSYRLETTRSVGRDDILDPLKLARQLAEADEQEEPSPAKVVWTAMDKRNREEISGLLKRTTERVEGGEVFAIGFIMRGMINDVIRKQDLYDAAVWKNVRLNQEGQDLVKKEAGSLSAAEIERRNLLLIQAAFPGQFQSGPAKSVLVTYLVFDFLGPWAAPETSIATYVEENVLPLILTWLVGIAAIFVAVVVTSPIIPSMFEPGSLHLLLSKPINRSLLFLAKFFGGCAFIFLNVSYLLGGFWLILGVRFAIWNRGLLICIPLFLLLFALYYSVSALSSVVWKSPVVSVMVTMLFWLACFVVGLLKVNVAEYTILNLQRITKIVPAGEELIVVNESNTVQRWSEDDRTWQQTFMPQDPGTPPFIGGPLIFDQRKDRLIGANGMIRPMDIGVPFTSTFGMRTTPMQLSIGTHQGGWRRTIGVGVPAKLEEYYLDEQAVVEGDRDDRLIAVSPRGIHRYMRTETTSVLGIKVYGGGDDFVLATEDPSVSFSTPVAAAGGPDGRIAVFSGGEVLLFSRNKEGKYVLSESTEVSGEVKAAGVGFGKSILVAQDDGNMLLLDAASLAINHKLRPVRSAQPRFIETSPDGSQFAVVYQDGRLWLIDAESGKARRAKVSGQGDISAVAFRDAKTLLVADRTYRVSAYELDNNMRLERRYAPKSSVWEWVYRYVGVPLYAVFPKPGELDNTVQYVLTGKQTSSQGRDEGIKTKQTQLRPWAPVWTGLSFMFVLLVIACVYIERQEF